LRITNILTTQVTHMLPVIREADRARGDVRGREAGDLPQGFGETLLALHSLDPFPWAREEIAAKRPNQGSEFSRAISPYGLHIYNRDG